MKPSRNGSSGSNRNRALAGDVRDAADVDDHRLARADRRRLAHRRSGEDRTGAALEPALLADPRLTPRHLQRHSRRDAAAGRAAVDLPAGEDADVAAGHVLAVAAIGQDRAVEEGEIGFVGMLDRHGLRDRLRDLLAGIDDRPHRRAVQIEADRIRPAGRHRTRRHRRCRPSPAPRSRSARCDRARRRRTARSRSAPSRRPRRSPPRGRRDIAGAPSGPSPVRSRPPSARARWSRGRTSSTSPRCA